MLKSFFYCSGETLNGAQVKPLRSPLKITTGTKEILNIFGRRHCCTTPFVILMMDLLRFVIGQFS